MSTLSAVTEKLIVTVEELNRRADQLLPEIGAGASQRERDRQLPFDAVAQIAKAGFYTTRIPVKYGGSGGSVKDVFALLIRIASVDSNVAQALRPGLGFVEGLLPRGQKTPRVSASAGLRATCRVMCWATPVGKWAAPMVRSVRVSWPTASISAPMAASTTAPAPCMPIGSAPWLWTRTTSRSPSSCPVIAKAWNCWMISTPWASA